MFERNIFDTHNDNLSLSNIDNLGITLAECAAFSLAIYGGVSAPSGWVLIHFYEGSGGYLGAAYGKNLLTNNAQVIFVHRGTVLDFPNSIGNFISDIEIAVGNVPFLFKSVIEFFQGFSDKFDNIYSKHKDLIQYVKVVSTGHSLGAVLSDCFVAAPDSTFVSITFENPGSKPAINKMLNDLAQFPIELQLSILSRLKTTCQAYQAGVNIINTCNEQVGKTFRIKNMAYDYFSWDKGPYFPITASYKFNPFYVIGNTLDQHRIDRIVEKLKPDNFFVEEIQNPIGFNAGYVDYLDEKHQDYWKNYFTEIWNSNPGTRDEYKNDKDKYLSWCFEILRKTQQEASSSLFIAPANVFNNQLVLFKSKQKNKDNEDILNDFVIVERKAANLNEEEKSQSSICSVM